MFCSILFLLSISSWRRSCKFRKLDSNSRAGESQSLREACISATLWRQLDMASNPCAKSLAFVSVFFFFCSPVDWPPPFVAALAPPPLDALAEATASNCSNRRVFGTSLPFSTSAGSKSTCMFSCLLTASAICCKTSSLPSRLSGQSSLRFAGNPVACPTNKATSWTNFGGGRASSSCGERFLFMPSSCTTFVSVASVPSTESSQSAGTQSCKCRSSLGPFGTASPPPAAAATGAADPVSSPSAPAAKLRSRSASGPTLAPPGMRVVPRTTKAAVVQSSRDAKLLNSPSRASACCPMSCKIFPTSSTADS
mmetsp:Transcript_472/g.940  ORF Transcript_472/g.940 Transcript_472/m.940 type:complete len:310 (-) Transcript_472:800-1729(-)